MKIADKQELFCNGLISAFRPKAFPKSSKGKEKNLFRTRENNLKPNSSIRETIIFKIKNKKIIYNVVRGGESYINKGLGLISTNSLLLIDTRTHQSIYSTVSNISTSTPDQAYASTNKVL